MVKWMPDQKKALHQRPCLYHAPPCPALSTMVDDMDEDQEEDTTAGKMTRSGLLPDDDGATEARRPA